MKITSIPLFCWGQTLEGEFVGCFCIYVFLGFLLEGSWSGPTPSSRSIVLSMQAIDRSPVQSGIVTRKAPWKCDLD